MKNRRYMTIISILTILSFVIGFSYAYFTTIVIGNDTSSTHVVTIGTLQLTFDGTDNINLGNAQTGDSQSKTFTVKNTGTLPIESYEVYFSNMINTLAQPGEVVYTLTCSSSDITPCNGVTETQVPTTSSSVLIQSGGIASNTTHTYTLTLEFKETGTNQNYNQGKQLSFKVTINELETIPPTLISRLMGYNQWGNRVFRNDLFWEYRTNISEITFQDTINIPSNTIEIWDVSKWQNNSIMAYIIDDGLGNDTYHLYVQSNEENIYANENMESWFAGFYELTQINNLNILNTSQVIDTRHMFNGCSSLTDLNLTSFNTSQVTNMIDMFRDCSSLTDLNLTTFNTSQVTSMSGMFDGCSSLTDLNLTTFNTSQVTSMSGMFDGCSSLTTLNLSSFDTSQVTNMSYMFDGCSSLTTLNLSSFDTSQVTSMHHMFANCILLTQINLSNSIIHNGIEHGCIFDGITGPLTFIVNDIDSKNLYEEWYTINYCPPPPV